MCFVKDPCKFLCSIISTTNHSISKQIVPPSLVFLAKRACFHLGSSVTPTTILGKWQEEGNSVLYSFLDTVGVLIEAYT